MDRQGIFDVFLVIEPFNVLEPGILERLSTEVAVQEYRPGDYVFKQGEASLDTLFIIVSGLVEITVTNDQGMESVVGLRKPGDFFSETVVLSRGEYPAAARVRDDLTAILVPRTALESLIHGHPEFSSYFSALLAERMRLLYEKLLSEPGQGASVCSEMPLFRKRVSEIMSTSVAVCTPFDQVSVAARRMAEKGISSTVVVDESGLPVGIVTEKLMVNHLITNQTCPVDDCRVHQVMAVDFDRISPDAFTGEVLVRLTRFGSKYLVVVEGDRLVGIVTTVDLVKSRSMGNLTLLKDIETLDTLPGLIRVSSEIDGVLNALMVEKAGVPEILEVMSELHERLVRAVIRVSEQEMEQRGLGPPPVPYCWINMGSDARHEQTLRTDQDNAMIYADPVDQSLEQVDRYFETLAGIIVQGLDQCGFKLCKGDVMGTNPKWRRSLSQWLSYVESWRTTYDPEDSITMTILLDFRPVWGDKTLADRLWNKIFTVFDDPEKINHMLTNEAMKFSVPLTFMGAVRTEKTGPRKNQVNIKSGGLVHMINGIRLFAVNNRISEPSTLGRLEALTRAGVISKKRSELFRASFETLVMLRIRGNLNKVRQNQEPDNHVDMTALSNIESVLLKDALTSVGQMQKLVYNRFTQTALNFFS
ncbi:MAG: cyclic nucleotide-binding domain-containing protein [Desulfobacterium sp.]|nr:cyclic nucleotide-binding domain-containing protein [Desulfobacterium sp.]